MITRSLPDGNKKNNPDTAVFRWPSLVEIASDFLEAGISVIPLALDGSKKAALKSWKPYQSEPPTAEQVREWWSVPQGLGVVCGVVSGGLEVLDFDDQAEVTFPQWYSLIEEIAVRLPVVETPSGGYHVYYRCGVICGNRKIAMADGLTLIESRGEGGYIVGTPSPAAVHATKTAYIQVAGPVLPEIPTISEAERLRLWQAGRTFDRAGLYAEQAAKVKPREPRSTPIRGDEPWHQFNATANWEAMLRADGWRSTNGIHWTRPGKRSGTSATLREAAGGDWVLVVFYCNAGIEMKPFKRKKHFSDMITIGHPPHSVFLAVHCHRTP
jgi:putative DNA primase/helicase